MTYVPAKIIAEIGCVHVGLIDRAKDLIRLAALCGAQYVKLQKRNPIESVPKSFQSQPHPNQSFAYGETYLEHRMALELSVDQHREIKGYCESIGIKYAASVWDVTSAREIISLRPEFIKVPSACNMNRGLLEVLTNEYDGDIHISTGMIDKGEKLDLYALLSELEIQDRVVLYHCTSEYPCPFERMFLLELNKIKWAPAKELGFSNHGYGIAADIVAYILGAQWIERHFIDDRTFRHTDASASLEPDGLRRLCRDLKAVFQALQEKDCVTDEEMKQRDKLRVADD